jgi:DNA-binding SARP family transcriptional activator/Flp pilus assembly protein TadD
MAMREYNGTYRAKNMGYLGMRRRYQLLGALTIEEDGRVAPEMQSNKGCALLAALIIRGKPQSRETLADLLWESETTAQSLTRLRNLVSRVHKWIPELLVNRKQLSFQATPDTSIDLTALNRVLNSKDATQLNEGLQLYKGDLLDGFYLEDSPRFNEWLLLERENLRRRVINAYRRLCKSFAEQQAWPKGIEAAQRWLALDEFDEEALRFLMELLAASGQIGVALQQYKIIRERMWEALGVKPDADTMMLAQRLSSLRKEAGAGLAWDVIVGAQLAAPVRDKLSEPGQLPPSSIVPYQRNMDFTGRREALLHLARLLLPWPDVNGHFIRVATITGMGGIGKTQLAVEFCYRYGRYFPGGVFWLNFDDAQNVVAEIASVGSEQGMELYREAEQLTLSDRVGKVRRAWQEAIPRLLIFDNCEDEGLLAEWMPVTGGSRVLVTCRRSHWSHELQVDEWPLRVLKPPESVRYLRKLAPELHREEALEIASELGHLPLALQLAGSFLQRYRQVSADRYLLQLREMGLLGHPSLQGRGMSYSPTGHELNVFHTFAISFEKLDPADEIDHFAMQLLARAACFAPGEPIPKRLLLGTIISDELDLEAVLQAEDGLERLIELGFIKREGPGTVVIHSLVVAFANVISATNEESIAAVGNTLVKVLSTSLNQQGHLGRLPIAANHLSRVTNMALSAQASIAVRLGTLLGHHLRDIADYNGAREVLEKVLSLSSLTNNQEELADAWIGLARAQRSLGQDQDSLNSAEQAEHLLRTADSPSSEILAHVLHRKGWSLFMLGRAEEAITAAEEALSLSRKVNSDPETVSNLNLLGEVHLYLLEQYDRAVQYIEEASEIARNTENVRAEAVLLSNLGEIVERQGDLEKAFHLYQKAMTLSIETENKDKEIFYRANMGRAQVLLGAYDRAVDCLEKLIDVLPQKTHVLSEVYYSLAGAYLGQGRLDLAVTAGQQALTHARPQDRFVTGQAWAILGRIAAQLKAPVCASPNEDVAYDARDCFKQSLEAFSTSRSQWGRALVLWYWSEAELLQGDKELGSKLWSEAWDIFTRLNLPLMAARMETSIRELFIDPVVYLPNGIKLRNARRHRN